MKAHPLYGMLIGLLACAVAGARADEKAVTLARTYKEGQIARYKSTIRIHVSGNDAIQNSIDKSEVKEVRKNGDVVVALSTEKGSYTFNGQEHPVPSEPPAMTVRDKYNRLLKYDRPETLTIFLMPEVRQVLVTLADVVFPDKPVAPADVWETDLDNPMVKDTKIHLKTTYVGVETVDGAERRKVHQSATADTKAGGAPLTADLTAWLDPANGLTVKLEYTLKGVPTQFGSMDSVATMSLLPTDSDKKAEK